MPTSIPTSDLDLYSDDVLTEPYEQYRRLREAGTVVWLERYNCPGYANSANYGEYSSFEERKRNCYICLNQLPLRMSECLMVKP